MASADNSAGLWGGAVSYKLHRTRQFAQIEGYDAIAQLDPTAHVPVGASLARAPVTAVHARTDRHSSRVSREHFPLDSGSIGNLQIVRVLKV
jgi:hypothetical protein